MFNNFYGLKIEHQLGQLDLFSYLGTAEEYSKVHNEANELFDPDGNLLIDCSTEPVFISVKDEAETYVVFYQNLFFIFFINNETDEKVVQIYVKRPDDMWRIPVRPDGSFDFFNPSNTKVNVYGKYDVILRKFHRDIKRCDGEVYNRGVWNKMVYKSLNSFLKIIDDYTEINQIKQAYSK